ncbi:hypothetical protein JTE90_020948 [Oedothorax gibbosus]|uniref:Membrane progestin receptor gamma n=1 Tax=Oedothorax gibbosus TaxID=931172 RepID=A0AAV6VPU3_9ARAC|nr:hypothetical protein JTE90_020948 [Oedothorax gibbosus]
MTSNVKDKLSSAETPSLLLEEKETEHTACPDDNIQTKFNLFVSKLCISEETKNLFVFDAYKAKMSQIIRAPPDISLYKDEDLPPHLREIAILTGYRSPSCSYKECALSVFVATNETLNFWTHFIPTFYFLYQLFVFWDGLKVINEPYYWPFIVYMFTICIYPLISALAHTFYSTSEMARHVWFFLDYGGLSLYSFGVGLLYKAYAFPEELIDTVFGRHYLEVLVILSLSCNLSACFSRFLDNLVLIKIFRLGAFAMPWVWDQIPVVYRLSTSTNLDPVVAENYYLQFFFSFCIFFFYASHLPERLAPGKFDFFGNSHQLLHISGIMATHYQMNAVLMDMNTRRILMEEKYPFPVYWSVEVTGFVFFTIIFTILIFIVKARQYENKCNELKRED